MKRRKHVIYILLHARRELQLVESCKCCSTTPLMRTRYCSVVCAFLLEERFSVCSRTPRGYLASAQEATGRAKTIPSDDNFIFIDVSTFLTADALLRVAYLLLSFARRPRRNEEARSLPRSLQPRFLRVFGFVFTNRRSRPWANVHANRPWSTN